MAQAAILAVGLIANTAAQHKQQKAADKSADIQEGIQHTQKAGEEVKNSVARRKAIRAERVRRAKLLSASESSGVSDSSSVGASLDFGQTGLNASIAQQRSEGNFADSISASLAEATSVVRKGDESAAKIKLAGDVVSLGINQFGKTTPKTKDVPAPKNDSHVQAFKRRQ